MATHLGTKAAAGVQARQGNNYSEVYGTFPVTAVFTDGDLIRLCKLPKGAVITKLMIVLPDMDSGADWEWTLGDPDSAARYLTGSTVGQTAGVVDLEDILAAGFGYQYTDDSYLDITVTDSGDATTGTIKYLVGYTVDP